MPLLDITAFASAWTALYTHFHAIGYLPPNSVSYPPHTPALPIPVPPPGSNSLQTLLPPLRPDLHPLVLSLLPLLPYPASYDHASTFEILPRTRAQPYTDEGQLLRARDPEMDYLDEEPRLDGDESVVLRREEVALTKQLPQGWTIVVDVAEGTLREYSTSDTPPGSESSYHYPDNPSDRRNWPVLPAVERVREYVAKFESLEWIAWRADNELGIVEPHNCMHARLKKILIDDYGWPGTFRRGDWIRERDEVMRNLYAELG